MLNARNQAWEAIVQQIQQARQNALAALRKQIEESNERLMRLTPPVSRSESKEIKHSMNLEEDTAVRADPCLHVLDYRARYTILYEDTFDEICLLACRFFGFYFCKRSPGSERP